MRMAEVKIVFDQAGNTLTVWFADRFPGVCG
jgi:hypothetical protein